MTLSMKGLLGTASALILLAGVAQAQTAPKMEMTTPIPDSIVTPQSVETRLGTLKFFDGFPDKVTAEKLYDNLDFMRGVDAFLNAMPGASAEAIRVGVASQGADNNQTILIFEDLMDSRSLFLTGNTESIYNLMWLDTKAGPLVIETPPNILGMIDTHWFKYVGDVGNAGPDRGKGGKYLLLPPGYQGEIPDGYFVLRSSTYGNLFFWRGFLEGGSTKTAVENTRKFAKVCPLSEAGNPPPMKFINVSGKEFNTIHANNFHFFEEVNNIVQYEPNEAYHPEVLGQLAAIGIEKGKPFAPDERMKKILTEAVAVGNATARTITFDTRMKDAYYYPDSAWFTGFVGGSYEFLAQPGVRNLDARVLFHYYATGITPAMAIKRVGIGSQYAAATTDSENNPLDGSKTYKVRLPPNIPAKDFWSFVVYDNQTRSMLQTDQQFPSIGSDKKDLVINADSSVDVWFGPTAPAGHEANWVQTVPGKGWNVLLRLYGPLEPWFDKSWKPGEFEPVK
ncbi:DUF1254 domain-containing protein [Nordella sp. HKS 07]|uniref:DUF1254 domain-containing protein n=1 Tax=Nordella sp. HKS 07 TaxID=2712222 RepID=UPI0013E1B1F4|nr:DUF1254 domain-containing protein [Nordella sp. HKS 07]QIG52405.1 DUF1254 domain-containing protein [Nordella sp. HKS 07]